MYMRWSIEIEAIAAIGEESRERQKIYQRVAEWSGTVRVRVRVTVQRGVRLLGVREYWRGDYKGGILGV